MAKIKINTVDIYQDSVTGNEYKLNPDGTFTQISASGAEYIADGALASGPIYNDGTYKYFGEATPGTALNAASWRVSRMNISTSRIDWADGNGNFDNVFTDQATVAALTYV